MTTITVDVETQGLDVSKFILATTCNEDMNQKVFYNKDELWEYLIDLGKKNAKHKKVLKVYGHNHIYDFYAYAQQTNKTKWFSTRPFIVYQNLGDYPDKSHILFLDTMALYPTSLAMAGQQIGQEKWEMPEYLQSNEGELTPDRIEEITKYCKRDTYVTMMLIKELKKKLKEEGVQPKTLYTINQVAIAYLMKKLRLEAKEHSIWKPGSNNLEFCTPRHWKKITTAYKGGICENWDHNEHHNVYEIDCNSLYPMSLHNMRFPNLRTETYVKNPTEKTSIPNLLKRIGVSRAMIYNNSDKMPILPIRTPTTNHYFKKGTWAIGTWTHIELVQALKNGYEILGIEWSIIYKDDTNPFKGIIKKLYKGKREAKTPFERWFYKMMMNAGIGKMGQNKRQQVFVTDNASEVGKYLKMNWEIVNAWGTKKTFKKELTGEWDLKPYYNPIIPTLVNAHSRLYMFENLQKIPQSDLLYCDTDSIIMKGNHLKEFQIGEEMGQFKIVHENTECYIYGKKTYSIGTHIKVSGMHTKNMTMEQFKSGKVSDLKQATTRNKVKGRNPGEMYTDTRDLLDIKVNNQNSKYLLDQEKIFTDSDILLNDDDDTAYFKETIKKIIKNRNN